MPAYELTIIYKVLNKPELVSALKRTAKEIWDKGGIIKKLENLGVNKTLPYNIHNHGQGHKKGSYFMFHYDTPPTATTELAEYYHREIDIIKAYVQRIKDPEQFECTLEEELLPPAYRKDVARLEVQGKRKRRLFKPFELVVDTKPF